MKQSRLSHSISLCKSIDTLNDSGCLEVLRVLHPESSPKTLNEITIHVMMHTIETMSIEYLLTMKDKIESICHNSSFRHNQPQNSKNTYTSQKTKKKIQFPLLRLPIDILKNSVSFFLNERDIFRFEKCCRLFYQIINNSSYLKQSNNFKTFVITNNEIVQMLNPKRSFYKYSQADRLLLYGTRNMSIFDRKGDKIPPERWGADISYWLELEKQWKEVKAVDGCYHQLFANLRQNIKSLEVDVYSKGLLDKQPLSLLSILSDSQSNLTNASFSHCPPWNFGSYLHEFDSKYKSLKEEMEKQGKKMKKLQLVEHSVPQHFGLRRGCKIRTPENIETVHLSIKRMNITSEYAGCIGNLFNNIRILTLINRFTLDESDLKEIKYNTHFNIDTLRLINFLHTHDGNHGNYHLNNSSICDNQDLIEKLNLQSSLKNLTLNVYFGDAVMELDWIQAFKNILLKNNFYYLTNVNILLETEIINIETFFNILKENVNVLKHQFKQLNIGLCVYDAMSAVDEKEIYYVFEWNTKINCNILMKKQEEIMNQLIDIINVKQTLSLNNINNSMKDRYYTLQQQIEW